MLEPEAEVVQAVFRRYTQESVSINAIARELNERGVGDPHRGGPMVPLHRVGDAA